LDIPADYDGDVDQGDYMLFEDCASGPEIPHAVDCDDRDFEGDSDGEDFAVFQRCISGEDMTGDLTCAN
jgi:hypothetical protein